MDTNWTQTEIFLHNILQLLDHQTDLLEDMRMELKAIREATETEAVEDSEDPFQTLNGPSKDKNPLRYGVKGEYGE